MQIRCPHCQNGIELVDESDFQSVDCPSCGSQFGLVDVEQSEVDTLSKSRGTKKTIGHFELIEEVGRGAFGTVWRARDAELDRQVAIKIPRGHRVSIQDREQFLREARAAAQLSHPNIVVVFEVGRAGDQLYIVSDYVEGVTLAEKIAAKRIPPREAVELCMKIAGALEHAHGNGVIHRDLKPSNIMLTQHGEPQVMDFGLAKRDAGEITMTVEGRILGTPAYMPPEQARGEAHHVDRRADVYSLGVILYELLTGELPFRGATRMLLQQVIYEEPSSLRRINNTISRDLEVITLKCLQKDPAGRYQTAQALSYDLGRWFNGKPIEARPIANTERTWRWVRRNPMIAALATAVALLVVFGLILTSKVLNQAGEEKLVPEEVVEWKIATLAHTLNNGDSNTVGAIAFSPDGKRIVSGCHDMTVKIWDAESGKEINAIQGHSEAVLCVDFSPDGKQIVSGSSDHTLKIWDAQTYECLNTFEEHSGMVRSVAFGPDGKRIVSGSDDKKVKVWDAQTYECLKTFEEHGDIVFAVGFSPSGNRIVSGGRDDKVMVWVTETREMSFELSAEAGDVNSVRFSPDGKMIVSSHTGENAVYVWNSETGHKIYSLDRQKVNVGNVAITPDGKQIITTSETAAVWDVETGEEIHNFGGGNGPPRSLAISPEGKRIAIGFGSGEIRIWDARPENRSGRTSTVLGWFLSVGVVFLLVGTLGSGIVRKPGPLIGIGGMLILVGLPWLLLTTLLIAAGAGLVWWKIGKQPFPGGTKGF